MDNNQGPDKDKREDILFEKPTYIDPLTGLFNQLYLHQFLPEEIKKAKLSNYLLSLLILDLDGFKTINDTYGHLCGDAVLKEISGIIKNKLRRTDAVIRYGGDEFILLLPAVDIEKAKEIANKIISEVAKTEFKGPENQSLHFTLSIGFAVCPLDTEESDKLIDMADKALYLAKKKGKNMACHIKEVSLEAISSLIAMDSFPCPKFIDRESQINRLKQIFDAVSISYLLQAVFIHGQSGVGKTRIFNEIRNYLKDKVRIISCSGSSKNTQDPYFLFAKGIESYLNEIGIGSLEAKTVLSKIPSEELVELGLLIPQLAAIAKTLSYPTTQDSKKRLLLFKGFLDFLIELNKTSVILLAFDDIHFADKASLELLRYLIKQERNKRIYIISTFLEDELKQLPQNTYLKDVLQEISLRDNFIEIELSNLTLEDTKQIVNAIFPKLGETQGFIELLYSTTNGNPCFIEETLKSLIENGTFFYQDDKWQISKELTIQDMPVSLEEIIKKRIKNLDEETKEMILQAAVIGEDFQMDILQKIGDKNEGFALELLNRAKKMRLIDELEIGKFRFTNKEFQEALYSELNDFQRNSLHYKVAKTLETQHKDNLYNVAGELAFHFSRAALEQDALGYSKLFSDMTSEIFDAYEIIDYLKRLGRDIISEEEKPGVKISDEIKIEVMKLIRLFQGAIKIFRLYPPHSTIRTDSITEAYKLANDILFNRKVERIDISEVEKSLVINAKRINPKELQDSHIEDFIFLLMDHNIRTISFINGLQEKELDSFIQYLGIDYSDIVNKGGWQETFRRENVVHIKVDEVQFISQKSALKQEFQDKVKLQDTMLMEFLLGKLDNNAKIDKDAIIKSIKSDPKKFAETIMEIAESVVKEDKAKDKIEAVNNVIEKIHSQILTDEPKGDYAKDVARIIIELEPLLRNKFIRSNISSPDSKQKEVVENVIANMPDEVIVDIISEEYNENTGNLLKLKDFINNILKDKDRKNTILPKLESKLSGFELDKQDISFLTEQIKWEDLSTDKKINNLMRISKDASYAIRATDIRSILEQAASLNKKEELYNGMHQLLVMTEKFNYANQKEILKAITDFVKEDLGGEKYEITLGVNRLDALLDILKAETEPQNYSRLLSISQDIINDSIKKLFESKDIFLELEYPMVKKYSSFINGFVCALEERLKLKDDYQQPVHQCIRNCILNISEPRFLEVLILSLVSSVTPDTCNIKELSLIIGDPLIDALINLGIERVAQLGDPFKRYVIQQKILNILTGLGERSLNRLKVILVEESKKEEVNVFLIELVGYLKKEEFIDNISPFIEHKNTLVRGAAIRAMAEINTDKTIDIILQVAKTDRDKNIRILARNLIEELRH